MGDGNGSAWKRWLLRIGITLTAVAVAITVVALVHTPASVPAQVTDLSAVTRTLVGSTTCATCHAQQAQDWRGSHHAQAMQAATAQTVLGDFKNASLSVNGVMSTFFQRDGGFWVRTDGADGTLQDFRVAYTFGVTPLQQYLIAFPDGRMQALSIAWDSRAAAQGGQRWYHLNADEKIGHNDPLHWTRHLYTWNHRCAECHSTGLDKGFDAQAQRWKTTWHEINVACEACHGPGSRHVEMARTARWDNDPAKGFAQRLPGARRTDWVMDPATGIVRAATPRHNDTEIGTCGRCHARRSLLDEGFHHDHAFDDDYRLETLRQTVYHADGQIEDEVYEMGSFVQSRMYHAGVTCSDCHEPHTSKLRAEGNLLCARCHLPTRFDTPAHHHHAAGTPGAQCINCHMPTKTYMGVDVRRDHSFRVPRPDLSQRFGTPNACTQCHADRKADWAEASCRQWYGPQKRDDRVVAALSAGRTGAANAVQRLAQVIADGSVPSIARATAVDLIAQSDDQRVAGSLRAAANDPDPRVRSAAAEALVNAPEALRQELAQRLLGDPVRAVRVAAVPAMLPIVPSFDATTRAAFATARVDYETSLRASADTPEGQVAIAALHLADGDQAGAERAYRAALQLDDVHVPALLNLADHLRARGDDSAAEALLRQAIAVPGEQAAAHHALGLLLVRRGDVAAALAELRQAAELRPDQTRFSYVLAIAQHDTGNKDAAIATLVAAQQRQPADRALLTTLIQYLMESGDRQRARTYATQLQALDPDSASSGPPLRDP